MFMNKCVVFLFMEVEASLTPLLLYLNYWQPNLVVGRTHSNTELRETAPLKPMVHRNAQVESSSKLGAVCIHVHIHIQPQPRSERLINSVRKLKAATPDNIQMPASGLNQRLG